jgi:uridylate kinase
MATTPRYSRILYKVSGEALMGNQGFGIDRQAVDRIVDDILEARAMGVSIAIVVGGGNIFRGVSLAANGADRVTGDHMGMLAIMMNALALRMAFDARQAQAVVLSGVVAPQICESFSQRALIEHRDAGKIIIFAGGTGNPYFTSDTAAALRAAEFGAGAIFKGTQVDGVYSDDPRTNPDAMRFETLTHADILEKRLKIMDASAVALAADNNIPIVVFSIANKGGLAEILAGRGRCTTVA